MRNNFEQLFDHMDVLEPDTRVYDGIIKRITRERERIARVRLLLLSTLAVLSLGGLVVTSQHFIQDFYQSGLYEYVSLLFSDGTSLLFAWKDFVLTIVESLPITSSIAVLATVFMFLASIKFASDNLRAAHLRLHH